MVINPPQYTTSEKCVSGADPIFEVSREPYNYIHLFYHCIRLVVDLFDDIQLVVMNVCV